MDILKKNEKYSSSISNHKFANILDNIGNVDITHNINFDFLKNLQNNGGLEII